MVFTLNEKESAKHNKFTKKHSKCNDRTDTIGTSHIETIFVATGLGYIISVKCKKCGKEKDITDYDMW